MESDWLVFGSWATLASHQMLAVISKVSVSFARYFVEPEDK
jgi:hypothetical protein